MMKHLFTITLLFWGTLTTFSQQYKPIDTADYNERTLFIKELKNDNSNLLKKFKSNYDYKTSKALEKIYNDFNEIFSNEIKKKNFTFKSDFEKYIQKIINELAKNNTEIPQTIKILIAKNNSPNAYCLANGTLVINMGLFNVLENEGQIASVISHELAHKIRQHVLNSQLKKIKDNESNKNIILSLKDVKYDKSLKAFDILKKQAYFNGSIVKKQEIESDSVGYTYYKKSKYKKDEFIKTLANIKEFDSLKTTEINDETYKKLFHLEKQPFNENWLKQEDFSGYNYNHYKNKLDKDSISSHPELVDRITILKNNFEELSALYKPEPADDEFNHLKHIAEMEILPNLFYDENYGKGIYTCMQYIQENKNVDYSLYWLGKFFEKIYEGRKNYKLNNYLDQIEPKKQSKSYIKFLNFMWNLKLEEIKNIAKHYNKASS